MQPSKPAFKEWEFGQRKHVSSSSPYATCHQKWWIKQKMHFFDSIAWRAWWAQVLFLSVMMASMRGFFFLSLATFKMCLTNPAATPMYCCCPPNPESSHSPWPSWSLHPPKWSRLFIRVWCYEHTIFLTNVLKVRVEGLSLKDYTPMHIPCQKAFLPLDSKKVSDIINHLRPSIILMSLLKSTVPC